MTTRMSTTLLLASLAAASSAGAHGSNLAAIQDVVFEGYRCTSCHGGSSPQAELDLTQGRALADLLDVTAKYTAAGRLKRVESLHPERSALYLRLLKATNCATLTTTLSQLPADVRVGVEDIGSAMPDGIVGDSCAPGLTAPPAGAVTADHLEAIRLWILRGASAVSEDADIEAKLEQPAPNAPPRKIAVPATPSAEGESGVQLRQPPYPLARSATAAATETEVCMATYYDLTQTNLIPPGARVPCPPEWGWPGNDAGCFYYDRTLLQQDRYSHHSLVYVVDGSQPFTIDDFEPWRTRTRSDASGSTACNPRQVDAATGINATCAGAFTAGVACFGFPGGGKSLIPETGGATRIGGAQSSTLDSSLSPGTYGLLPMKGIVVWNSHAFNSGHEDGTMEQYLNVYAATPSPPIRVLRGILEQGANQLGGFPSGQFVEPFAKEEFCRDYTLPAGAKLESIASHTHQRGVLFRIWANDAHQTCKPATTGGASTCGAAFYETTDYDHPPLLDRNLPTARTLSFCALYNNGQQEPAGSRLRTPPVKRRSTSPSPPGVPASPGSTGGPCRDDQVRCLGGDHRLCGAAGSPCDAGDTCDACPVGAGLTSDDEMMLLFVGYSMPFTPPGGAPAPRTVDLVGRTWMAENLDLEADGSLCFRNDAGSCQTEGRLYTWQAARTICGRLGPGWRLPTDDDWRALTVAYGGAYGDQTSDEGRGAYAALVRGGRTGFDGSFGGKRYWFLDKQLYDFYDFGVIGYYWADALDGTGPDIARIYTFRSTDGLLLREGQTALSYASVRCVRDAENR